MGTLGTVGVRLLPLLVAVGAGLPPDPVSIGAPGGEEEVIGAYLVRVSLPGRAVVKPTGSATMKTGNLFAKKALSQTSKTVQVLNPTNPTTAPGRRQID